MADGKIIIDTAINTKGFEEGGRELENAGQKVAASMDEIMRSVNDSFSGIDTKAVVRQFETLDDVVERAMSKIASAATSTTGADAMADRSVTIPKSSMGYDQDAIEAIENYSAGIDDATQGINEMLAALKAAEEEVKRLEGVGKFFGDAEYDDAVLKLQKVKADVASYKRELADAPRAEFLDRIAQSAQIADQKIIDLKLELDSLKARQQNLSAAGITYGYEEFDKNAARVAEINREINNYSRSLTAAEAKNDSYSASNKRLGKSLDSSKKKVSGLSKSFKQLSAGNALTQGLTSVLKYAFGIQSLFRLFNQIRAYIGEGINNLVQFDSATNQSVSNIQSAMTTLKNSLATAFAPILTVVEPIITRFINMLSTAATYIGYFFAALTGQKTFTRAIAVQEDYAASLNNTTSSAGSAAKAIKKLNNLSGLDEINRWQNASDSSPGGGSGGSGGGGVGKMFETVNLEDVFKPIDWKKVGKTVSSGLIKVLDTISLAIDSVDWASLPEKVSTAVTDFFEGFDWAGSFESIGGLVGTALKAVFEFRSGVRQFIGEQVNKVITYFLDRISPELGKLEDDASILDIGRAIVKGVFQGIIDAHKNIGLWIQDNILFPFVEGFKNAFQINSPSKVMQELGLYILDGLLEGIKSKVSNVTDAWNDIKNKAVSAFEEMRQRISSTFSKLKDNIKSPINSIIGFLNGLILGITNAINRVISALNQVKITVPSWLSAVGVPFAGKSLGFNINKLSAYSIPYLAAGAVIPPNAPFMAMLGDQKHGRNLEMPENLLRQIVREESGGSSGNVYDVNIMARGRAILHLVLAEGKQQQMETGKNPFVLA